MSAEDPESAKRLAEKIEDDITRIENLAYFDEIEFYLPYLHPEEVSLFDYLPADAIVVLDEPMQIKSHWEQHEEKMLETLINRAGRGLLLASQKRQHVPFESTIKHALAQPPGPQLHPPAQAGQLGEGRRERQIESAPMDSFGGRIEAATDQIKTWLGNDQIVVVATAQDKRMLEILDEFGIAGTQLETHSPCDRSSERSAPGVYVAHAPLRSGFKLQDAGLVVLTDSEIFGAQRHAPRRARPRTRASRSPASSTSKRATTSSTSATASASIAASTSSRPAASSASICCSNTRRTTSSTCRPSRSTACRSTSAARATPPTVHRLGGSEWLRTTKQGQEGRPGDGEGADRALRLAAGARTATPTARTRPGSRRWSPRSPTTRPPTSSTRSTTSSATWRSPSRWTA